MNLNRLLNQPYLLAEDMARSERISAKKFASIELPNPSEVLIYFCRDSKFINFTCQGKVINSNESALELFTTNLEEIESDLFLMLYNITNKNKGLVTRSTFLNLNLAEKCNYLCIFNYPQDRNLYFLATHYLCLRRE